jgi:nitrate reductase (cytochrome), electron transfer subunit
MTLRTPSVAGLVLVLGLTGSVVLATIALLVALDRTKPKRVSEPGPAFVPVEVGLLPDQPIAAEALVFRGRDELPPAVTGRRRAAHPRTLATFHALRAYPGAPPRIPHGLTAEELRTAECNTCHERGGYSQRFGTYVPVTPHPEWTACLQCHVGNDAVMGVALPSEDPDATCRQCHAPGVISRQRPMPEWRPAAWLNPSGRGAGGSPPPIPHPPDLRGNCLACHSGPGAVSEIRTGHSERANCRQCHIAGDRPPSPFVRSTVRPADSLGEQP